MSATPSPRYSAVAIALHWAIAAAIAGLIAVGWYMGDLPNDHPAKENLYQMHKSVGITVLLLTLARILWRIMNPPPPLPEGMKPLEKTASHAVHIAFYVLMFAMPLTGWLYASTAYDFKIPTVLFGVVSWPDLPFVGWLANETGHSAVEFVHSKLAWVAIGLLVLHVAGALKHEFAKEEEGVLKRMIPGLFGKTSKPVPPPRGFLVAFGSSALVFALVAGIPLMTSAGAPAAASPVTQAATGANAWKVDTSTSEIRFSGTHQGNAFTGTFEDWSASIVFDPAALAVASAEVSVATGSAKTGTKLYDDSLKQTEWFAIKAFPTATVTLSDFESTGGNSYTATATLTLKDKPVLAPFSFTLDIEGAAASMTGQATFGRTPLDLGLQSDPGADYVSEDIVVDVTVNATRAE